MGGLAMLTFFKNWRLNRLLYGPSAFEQSFDGQFERNIRPIEFKGLANCHLLSSIHDFVYRSCIVHLRNTISPPAVSRPVPLFVVDSINREIIAWPASYITDKAIKVFPFLMYGNSPSSVERVLLAFGIRTSLNHVCPYSVLRRLRKIMGSSGPKLLQPKATA